MVTFGRNVVIGAARPAVRTVLDIEGNVGLNAMFGIKSASHSTISPEFLIQVFVTAAMFLKDA